ncbi:MAG: hypothetical protein JXA28_06490 [Bacteroidetes bacterium]|nr:hypothetical protein [Bacteroidota bacterium]
MSVHYTIRINGNEYTIERDEQGGFTVNGAPLDIDYPVSSRDELLRFRHRSFTTHIDETSPDGTSYRVNVNGWDMHVDLEDEKTALLRSLQSDKATKVHSALVRSPMPGKISRVLVNEGELIEAGQGVVLLEAMKMENEIKAPSAGIVKFIHIRESDTVEKNAVLIEIS